MSELTLNALSSDLKHITDRLNQLHHVFPEANPLSPTGKYILEAANCLVMAHKCLMEADRVKNEMIALNGTTQTQLDCASITSSSEEVKTVDLSSPYSAGAVVLSGTNWRRLAHENIVPDTAVVAADQALNTVYIEGTDYVLDYGTGRLKRVTGSAISDGGTVYVWYFYYTVHARNVDYQIDYSAGKLNRIEGGGIADGSTVYVSYITLVQPELFPEETKDEREQAQFDQTMDEVSNQNRYL